MRNAFTPTDAPDLSAIYHKLILWQCTGGQAGATADTWVIDRTQPAQTTAKVLTRRDYSSDTLDVWAVQVNLTLGTQTEENEEDDEHAVAVRRNNDDDNRNGIPDENDSNQASETGISGENNLVGVSLAVSPAGLPGGVLTLTLPAGNQFAVCGKRQKQGGRLPASSWNLGNGKVTPVVYLEGLHVCDPQALVLRYNWDSRLGADEVTDMVKARVISAAVCEAQFLLYQEDRDGYITEEKSAVPVGGNVSSLLAITLAPGTRVNAESAVVRVVDDYAPEDIYADWNVNFTSTAYWYVYQPGLLPDEWPQASQAPSVANQSGQPITLCYRMLWDTPWAPNLDPYIPEMGHNGAHTLSIKKVNGAVTSEIPFKQGDDSLDSVAPTLPVDVRNLVIKNVTTNNGTVDYFKYDPEPGSRYHRPVISFTVEDDGDPHEYDYYFIVRPTTAYGWTKPQKTYPESYGWDVKSFQQATTLGTRVNMTWNGSECPGGEADQAEWGTYTFEVFAYEYQNSNMYCQEWDDWFYYKWPYCLSLGEHDVWIDYTTDNQLELRCEYTLQDYAYNNSYNVYTNNRNVQLIAVNGNLDEIGCINGETDINTMHGNDGNGILVANGDNIVGFSRTIFTGEDYCWKTYRRDHLSSRMIAENKVDAMLTPLEAAIMADDIYHRKEGVQDVIVAKRWHLINVAKGKACTNLCIGVYSRIIKIGKTSADLKREWAVVNKGTTPSNGWDWINDIQQPFGASPDVTDSINYANGMVELIGNERITFIGHSKGGAEAVFNAYNTNKNCITFNPAPVNPLAYSEFGPYHSPVFKYKANMTAYIADGEVLDNLFATRRMRWLGKRVILPTPWYLNIGRELHPISIPSVKLHLMPTVIEIMKKEGIQ